MQNEVFRLKKNQSIQLTVEKKTTLVLRRTGNNQFSLRALTSDEYKATKAIAKAKDE